NQKTKSAERKRLYRQRWFRRGQRWRTGCEGRISALKRRHGMRRCLYRGFHGMQRWVGLSAMADNVIQIGRCLALQGTWVGISPRLFCLSRVRQKVDARSDSLGVVPDCKRVRDRIFATESS